MGSGWRRVKKALGLRVCTTVRRDPDEEEQPTLIPTTPLSDAAAVGEIDPNWSPNPRLCVNLGRRTSSGNSNPSTPPTQCHSSVSSPTLRCKTVIPGGGFSNPSSAANSPKSSSSTPASFFSPRLLCKTTKNPRMTAHLSAPSSPRSPSRLSLLMSSLRFNRSNCGICTLSTKTGQGTAIFTAECSHAFHFPCISSYVQKQGSLICPVCQLKWKEVPMLQSPALQPLRSSEKPPEEIRVYDDDEPLLHVNAGGRFNPIPEVQEEEIDEDQADQNVEFKGFPIARKITNDRPTERTVRVGAVPETALVGAGRGYENYALVLRVCAPPPERDRARRAPIDLVTVLDVSGSMSSTKLTMMKRAMRLVISSLGSSDRLSIVAFSSASKRLLPLRKMTAQGQRSARRVVDRLVCSQGTCVPEALRKAAKVLEDRRDRNPFVSIMLLSDGQDGSSADTSGSGGTGACPPAKTTLTRFGHVEIPVHSFGISGSRDAEDRFAQCVGGLLSVVVQDLHVQVQPSGCEINGVYSWHDRPRVLHQPSPRTGSALVRLGDFYAEEEREILVEVRVPSGVVPGDQSFSVKYCFRDPVTQLPVYGREHLLVLPGMQPSRIASLKVERLRNRFQTTRAAAHAAHFFELGDLGSAHDVLSSARSALAKSSAPSAGEHLRSLESELARLHWRHHQRQHRCHLARVLQESEPVQSAGYDNGLDALTPTSAWRAAERLAKLAIMRKSLNRVSDLHGFENARF